jgi:hypothetical protein
MKLTQLESTIHTARATKRIQASAFNKNDDGVITVDEKFFLKRQEFKRKAFELMHDVYYYITEYFSTSHISRKMSERYGGTVSLYDTYFSSDLFRYQERNIISYRIEMMDYKFFKYARLILMAVRRRNKGLVDHLAKGGKKLTIGYFLDLRTQKHLKAI